MAPVPSHRVVEDWMGRPLETLEDLLRPGLRAVCVGINPSRVSVAAGHYYQGRLGQLFFSRLRRVGLLPPDASGYEDDALFAEGVGFTDIVKRPTARARELHAHEFAHGRAELVRKLRAVDAPLVIFTYKKTAEMLFGRFRGAALLPAQEVIPGDAFVMPGPYAAREQVKVALGDLRSHLENSAGGTGTALPLDNADWT
jgi:TDG/mug DNA glycosylase family protein